MFVFKTTKEQLLEERQKNASLEARLAKVYADIEFIAMMTDVDIAQPELEEMNDEQI